MAKKNTENRLLTIYGSKVSKSGDKLVLTLVQGHDEDKTYYNACIKLDNSGKVKAKIDKKNNVALIKVNLLNEEKQNKDVLEDDGF